MNTSPPYSKNRTSIIIWMIWSSALLFFFYEFILRVFPSVMLEPLMESFQIHPEQIGLILSAYFYIYAPMQFPVGILIDRYGARRLLMYAAFLCGLCCFLFAFAHNVFFLTLARSMIGFGSSFVFVGLLYISSHWFERKRLSLLVGIANSAGMIGAATGEGPVSLLEGVIGWRALVVLLGVFGILLGFLFLTSLRFRLTKKQSATTSHSNSFSEAWKNLKRVLKHPSSWINSLAALFIYMTTSSFAALWGVTFLRNVHGLNRNAAGFAISFIYIGWIFGSPSFGLLFNLIKKYRLLFISACVLGFIFLSPVIYFSQLPVVLIFIFLFLVGFFSSGLVLNFTYAINLHPQHATGSAVAFTNFLTMISAIIAQPLVGFLLKHFQSEGQSPIGYQLAMSFFPVSFLIAAIFGLFLKEKRMKVQVKDS